MKQRNFVKGFIKNGGNGTQAALVSYDTTDPNVAKVIASENLTKPNIREAIEEALRSEGLTINQLVGNLGEIANSRPKKISGDTTLKANIELLKLHGAYPTQKSAHVSLSYRAELKKMNPQELDREIEKIDRELKEVMEEDPPTTPND